MRYHLKFLIIITFLVLINPSLSSELLDTIWTNNQIGNKRSIELSPDGKFLVVDSGDRGSHLINAETGEVITEFENIIFPKFSKDGNFIFGVNYEKLIKINTSTLEQEIYFEFPEVYTPIWWFWLENRPPQGIAYSPDMKYLFQSLGEYSDGLREAESLGMNIYELETMNLIKHIEHPIAVTGGVKVSFDNRYVSWGSSMFAGGCDFNDNDVLYDIIEDKIVESNQSKVDYYFHPNSEYFLTKTGYNVTKKFTVRKTSDFDYELDVTAGIDQLSKYKVWDENSPTLFYWGKDGNTHLKNIETEDDMFIPVNLKDNFYIDYPRKRIYHTTPRLTCTDFSRLLSVKNKDQFKLKINPNPVQDQVNILFQLEKPEQVELIITDILGNRVELVQSGFISSLDQNISYPISHLPTGVYLLTIKVGDIAESVKFIKE